ncbi:multicopper oxidase domain-containing protein [Streptomyces sp. NPDC051453]
MTHVNAFPPSGREYKSAFHCHNAEHEDMGMMVDLEIA